MKTTDSSTLDLGSLVQGFLEGIGDAVRQSSVKDNEVSFNGAQELQKRMQEELSRATEAVTQRYSQRTEAMKAVVEERQKRLESYAQRLRQHVSAEPGRFIVAGRVTDEVTGYGLPNVRVRVTDLDRQYDDVLGETRTDILGYYRLEYEASDFQDRDESPETYIEVIGEEDKVIFTSMKSFVQKAGGSAFISAVVDGKHVPASRSMSETVARTVEHRQQDLARRMRILNVRPVLEPDDLQRATLGPQSTSWRRPSRSFLSTLLRTATIVPGKQEQEREHPEEGVPTASQKEKRRHPVTDVKGIGATYQKRLADESVKDAETVATMSPAELAKILNTSETRAEKIVAAARDISQGE